jgi:hypothetical protein
MLREYSLVHESVRSLMMVVKQWANEYNICSAQVRPSIVEICQDSACFFSVTEVSLLSWV